ncbi:MAG: hypothetical protein V3U92_18175 [Cellulophaga sp.]
MSKLEINFNNTFIPKQTFFETSASYRYDIQYIRKSVEKKFIVRDVYSSKKENIHLLSLQSK